MRIIEKYEGFNGFKWLNFDYLPDSKAGRFEIYFEESGDVISKFIQLFNVIFNKSLSNVLIKTFGEESEWGDFCIDTWDAESDEYDYSPENKTEPTSSYLSMLKDSGVEPSFTGFCQCNDLDKFLYIIIHCVMDYKAPYSMMFYDIDNEIVFYLHHSCSFGVYYKELNANVKSIIEVVKKNNLEIKRVNDDRILSFLK